MKILEDPMRKTCNLLKPIFLLALILMVSGLTQIAWADTTGTIAGAITDTTGALVPGATVTLQNAATGLNKKITADQGGRYEFLAVPVGEGYSIKVDASGFEESINTNIVLLVNQVYHSDFKLQIGSVQATVSVSSAAAQVETTSTELGDVIGAKKMTDMPLNGRSYIDLLALQPGVVPISSSASNNDTAVSGNLSAGILSVNGAREDSNAFLVNGADVEESRNNGAAIIPNLDSIQEFRVLTDTYDAEYGRFAGGIVNVVTKSGTDQFHGSAFEFLRNDDLDARNYFDSIGPKGSLKQNQFGGAGGGPVVKNKLFFFSDYQGTRLISGATSPVVRVPSQLERSGNLSDLATLGYNQLTGSVRGGTGNHSMNEVLTQRLGYAVNNGEPYWAPGCNTPADGAAGRCVFPGEIIPQNVWSPAAAGLLQFIPASNGVSGGAPIFTTSGNNEVINDDKFGLRGDWTPNRSGRWSLYYFGDKAEVLAPYPQADVPGFGSDTPTRAQNASLSNLLTFGSSAVNDAEVSFTRFVDGGGTPTGGRAAGTLGKLGFDTTGNGIIPSPAGFEGVPGVSLSQLGVSSGMYNNTFEQTNNTYAAQDSYTKIIGRHTIKAGGQYRVFQVNELLVEQENGSFGFQGGETGNDFADLLIGTPDNFVQASPGALNARSKYIGVYAQDSFKALPNLTVNYGLRWDITQPWSDTQNRLQTFIPTEQSTRYPGAPRGWVFAGDPGVPSSIAPTQYNDLAPRLGIAYSPNASEGVLGKIFGGPGKTSIRGGFGIFYTAYAQISNQYELGDSPFAIFYVTTVPVYLEQPYTGRRGQDPGQRFPYVAPTSGGSVNWATFQPEGGQQAFLKSNVTPYNEQFNLNIQRQLGNSAIMTLAYVGTNGRHLLNQVSGNPGSAATCLQIASEGGGCGPFGEDTIYNVGSTVHDGTRPYSVTSGRFLDQGLLDFAEVPTISTFGSSNYNAFQASVQKLAGDFQILGSYTWSKALDNMSGFINGYVYANPFNHAASYGLSAFNVDQNFVASYSYTLPYKRLRLNNGLLARAVEGWQISGITRLTTGLPVQIVQSGDLSLCGCDEGGEPDYNGQKIQTLNPRRPGNLFFTASPFSSEPLGQFGTSRHSFFSGPGLNNTDAALHKMTPLAEGMSLEFRAEFFNVFNHAQFQNPSGNYGSLGTFGVVNSTRDPRIGQVALKLSF
jgi:Carboxypeptidase regulatory-like domain/TonB-dependent Receptor Plug Domain